MATLKQIAAILNEMELPQLKNVDPETGAVSYTLIADTLENIADFGKTMTEMTSADFEDFTKKFVGKVTDLALDTRTFDKSIGLSMPMCDFNAICVKGKGGLMPVTDDVRKNLQNGTTYNQDTFVGYDINQRVYTERHDFEIDYSIPRSMWHDAFLGVESALKICAYIENRVELTVNANVYAVEKATLRSIIKSAIDNRIKLVKEYNIANPSDDPLTTETAMSSYKFKLWVCETISNLADGLDSDISKLYNDGSIETHTPREDIKIKLLSAFANSIEMGLMSGTFHNELLTFGSYEKVPFWQTRTSRIPSIGSTSSIKFDNGLEPSDEEYEAFEYDNIVGVIFDKGAGAVGTYGNEVTHHYNAKGNFDNYFRVTDCLSMVDRRENIIVLTLEDE